jgi:hypothetical protein
VPANITYTTSVKSDSSQGTDFITVSATQSTTIAWSSPPTPGVYTVTVTGTVHNNYANVTSS